MSPTVTQSLINFEVGAQLGAVGFGFTFVMSKTFQKGKKFCLILLMFHLATAVSQVEHGVLRLVDAKNNQITVLVDCEGIPPYRIPLQMMRSCFSLLQDHYPNRLGCLFVVRLPPVVRVIAQALIQVRKSSPLTCMRRLHLIFNVLSSLSGF